MHLVSGDETVININGEVGNFFCNKRCLHQGDQISPFLFNLVADALEAMLDRARAAGHIKHIIPRGSLTYSTLTT